LTTDRLADVLASAKFRDPVWTASGQRRATVAPGGLRTLWFNTGTLCNITCAHCYIESSPRNDALAYITPAEVAGFLDQAQDAPLQLIGFTGGEPFMNPDIMALLSEPLARGLSVLVLTNAMRPMMRHADALSALHERFSGKLKLRVSLDHFTAHIHDAERGAGAFATTLAGLRWLVGARVPVDIAGRLAFGGEAEATTRTGFARLFAAEGIPVDATDPIALTLFPEMDLAVDVPEITEACWDILHVSPASPMCASSRMVVKRRGAARPVVLACTLIAYDERFEMGKSLTEATRPIALNHPHCARFCVLGGAACSR
jgi:uncharacterized Fe-S cluster-containing radical SAM superfamily protein